MTREIQADYGPDSNIRLYVPLIYEQRTGVAKSSVALKQLTKKDRNRFVKQVWLVTLRASL